MQLCGEIQTWNTKKMCAMLWIALNCYAKFLFLRLARVMHLTCTRVVVIAVLSEDCTYFYGEAKADAVKL